MTTYALTISHNGQTTDHQPFDSAACLQRALHALDLPTDNPQSGRFGSPDSAYHVSWGAWPGGWETDYAEYCAACGDLMWEGMTN